MSENDNTPVRIGMPEKKTGFRRLWPAIVYSLAGIRAAWRTETAFRQELAVLCILTPIALWLGDSAVERVLLIGSVVLVLIVELLNTAVESTVNRFGHEYNELTKIAKDTGSAAVFLSICLGLLTWTLIVLFP